MNSRNYGFSPTRNNKLQGTMNSKKSEHALPGLKSYFAYRSRTLLAIKLMRCAGWVAVLIAPWIEDGE